MDRKKKKILEKQKEKYMEQKQQNQKSMSADEIIEHFNVLPDLDFEKAMEELRAIRRGL